MQDKNPQYLVELGYNYQLKEDAVAAENYYKEALNQIDIYPVFGYYVAFRFESHALLDYAAQAYERTMSLRPEANYHIQLARIYGEQGKVEKMFSSYINFIERNNNYVAYAKRSFSEYIGENGEDENNIILRRVLLKKIQEQPNVLWNQLLSWLFVQQRDYNKAFAQEKAIYRRQQESLSGILNLADITIENDEVEVANAILDYIIDTALEIQVVLSAYVDKIELQVKHAEIQDYQSIKINYTDLLDQFGIHPGTLDLQLSYGHFVSFHLDEPKEASNFLKNSLKNKLNRLQQARVKLKLGDILVFQEKFNEALIYFSQVQTSLKNSPIAQEARFKVAKTSYYKGDFDWAESQLKILKSSSSQLIANDALDLKLLISDNKYEDSTQLALKTYAKADLYAYQNKTNEAISLLDQIIQNHKTETIVDQALYMQAQLLENQKEFEKARINYETILANYKEDILADDAYFALAKLYETVFIDTDKAKELYEQIIFNYADSIYFVEARKRFRALRGDVIN
jgi:TolA-binding protein